MKKRVLSLMLVLLMTLTLIPLESLAEAAASGTCGSKGDNLTWALDEENSVLTISGQGDMADYSEEAPAPWAECYMETVSVEKGVTGIGEYAFSSYTAATIELPEGLERIGVYAFAQSECFSEIKIPDSVKSIGSGAFCRCIGLEKATLPQKLTELSDSLFEDCAGLTEVNIPQSVTAIGENAFKGCKALAVISIPDGVKTIGKEAFASCAAVEELKIPTGVERIGESAFKGTNIESVIFDGTKERWTAIGGETSGIDIEKIRHTCDKGSAWLSNGGEHWHECSWCGKVSDKAAHEDKGDGACKVCGAKLSDVLAEGTISGLSWSLARSGALTISGSGELPELANDGTSVPWKKHSDIIIEVVIKSGVTGVGSGAFMGCTALKKVSISDTVKKLDLNAFSGCTALEAFAVEDGNEAYASADGVLFNAGKTRLISCPVGKTGAYTVPETVTEIEKSAFTASGVESVSMSDAVNAVGEGAFSNCSKLKSVVLPKGLKELKKSLFSGCSALEAISIPDSVKTLGEGVFSGCAALKEVKIPGEVTVIPKNAFSGCAALESVSIPASVTAIKEAAFDGCTALKNVTFLGKDDEWGKVTIAGKNDALDSATKNFPNHTHSYVDTVTAPTCTANGYAVHKCSCGDTKTDSYTKMLGHSYQGGICVRCGVLEDHKHDFKQTVTAPTCISEGFTTYTCACGESYKKNYVSALEHKPELKNEKKAGCLKGGYTGDEVCTVCGKVFKAGSVILALGHSTELRNEKAATCVNGGYTGDLVCVRCGDIIEQGKATAAAGHKFFGGKCSVCDARESGSKPVEAKSFDDVIPGTFYYDAVMWAVKNNITKGTGASTFSPGDGCTRFQIVTFLWRACGCPTAATAASFSDVSPSDSFYEAVLWAVERGITNGTGGSSFSPYATCTRAQIVTFLYRAAGSPTVSSGIRFFDVAPNAFCRDAVVWATERGITKGTSDTTFSPDAACTRAEVVTLLYRTLNK